MFEAQNRETINSTCTSKVAVFFNVFQSNQLNSSLAAREPDNKLYVIAALRQIRSIRRSVSRSVLLSLVTSLVLSRLDYGSSTFAGLPGYLLDRLQSVLNTAAH